MASAPSEYANLSLAEKLQKIVVEETKDVKFIFDSNDANNNNNKDNENDGAPPSKNARYDAEDEPNIQDENVVTILAHKKLLAASSPMFNAMFNGELKETGDVKIEDASAEAFREFLQIFYNKQMKLTMKNVDEVMGLVDKYDVDAGWPFIDAFFKRSLTVDDVLWCLHLAEEFQRDNLILLCTNMIEENVIAVCAMIDVDDSGKPKLRSNPNNRPISEDDLATIFSRIWRSTTQTAGVISIKLDKSLVKKIYIDQIEGISFSSNCTLLLTHITLPAIYTTNPRFLAMGSHYHVDVTIAEKKTTHKVRWSEGGTIKLSNPFLVEANRLYTIQTKITSHPLSCHPLIDTYRTSYGSVKVAPNICIKFDKLYYSTIVAAMKFLRYDN